MRAGKLLISEPKTSYVLRIKYLGNTKEKIQIEKNIQCTL